ncbi:MAG TPA: hypothetical protein ENL08_05425 [Bacteroidetes bacterium]|nr:hypothetical protein [Bacteroidota bacterium]
MRILLTAVIFTAMLLDTTIAAEAATDFNWWGMVAVRGRHESYKEYVDISASDTTKWGTVRYTDDNSKTRLGYKFGFSLDINEFITAAVTLRSGVGSVMWQDISTENTSGLSPGLQEAYIRWTPPKAQVLMGRIPQSGNAMWDLYAASNNIRDPVRQDNPTDGVFNDKMGFLNGIKLLVPVGPVTMRAVYHTDYVGGARREYSSSSSSPEITPQMDSYTYVGGLSVDIMQTLASFGQTMPTGVSSQLDFDYGKPHRIGDLRDTDTDSSYADEKLWGMSFKVGRFSPTTHTGSEFQYSYGYNKREGIYESRFSDYKLTAEFRGFRLTFRYQDNTQEMTEGIYKGHEADRTATHIYLNTTLWGLDIQPRYIKFETKVGGHKATSNERYEVTSTIRF